MSTVLECGACLLFSTYLYRLKYVGTVSRVHRIKKDRRQKETQRKQKAAECRKHLTNIRSAICLCRRRNKLLFFRLFMLVLEPAVIVVTEMYKNIFWGLTT